MIKQYEELKKEIESCESKQKKYHELLGKDCKKSEMAKTSLECIEAGTKLPLLKASLSQLIKCAKEQLEEKIKEKKFLEKLDNIWADQEGDDKSILLDRYTDILGRIEDLKQIIKEEKK